MAQYSTSGPSPFSRGMNLVEKQAVDLETLPAEVVLHTCETAAPCQEVLQLTIL